MHKYADSFSEKRVFLIIGMSAAASLLLSLANIGTWGFAVILTLYAGEHLLYPLMSEALNNHAPEEQRATTLSVANFLRTLPYVVLAPVIGFLNTHHHLEYFLVAWAILICFAISYYLINLKNNSQIKVS